MFILRPLVCTVLRTTSVICAAPLRLTHLVTRPFRPNNPPSPAPSSPSLHPLHQLALDRWHALSPADRRVFDVLQNMLLQTGSVFKNTLLVLKNVLILPSVVLKRRLHAYYAAVAKAPSSPSPPLSVGGVVCRFLSNVFGPLKHALMLVVGVACVLLLLPFLLLYWQAREFLQNAMERDERDEIDEPDERDLEAQKMRCITFVQQCADACHGLSAFLKALSDELLQCDFKWP